MDPIVHNISLNFSASTGIQAPVIAKQWDKNSHNMVFDLWDGAAQYSVPDGVTAMLRGRKADNTQFDAPCTVTNNIVTALLPEQALTKPGKVVCELALFADDALLKTLSCYLTVMPAAYDPGGVESSDEYAALDQMIQDGVAAVEDAQEATTAANAAAGAANNAASTANSAAESANEAAQAALDAAQGFSVVTDPTTGQQATVQTALNNIYNWVVAAIYSPLSAAEYDALGLTATAYDAKNITAQDYDTKSRAILIGG